MQHISRRGSLSRLKECGDGPHISESAQSLHGTELSLIGSKRIDQERQRCFIASLPERFCRAFP